jgi:3-oxoacyl-[acyl-carrier protein] reductase
MALNQTTVPRFHDQVAIITGAGTGIGAAAAELFVAEGGRVVLIGQRREKLDEVASRLSDPARYLVVPGSVTESAIAHEAVEQAVKRWGRLDVLVSNAAVCPSDEFLSASPDAWRRVVDVVLQGAFNFAQASANAMIQTGTRGRIVAVSSVHASVTQGGTSHYATAKAGLNMLVRSLAVELAPQGIRVNAVAPGFVDTPMSVQSDGKSELESEWFVRDYVQKRRIPMARAAQPREIARTILFLASDESSYVNGHVLVADGGLTCTF